MRQEKKEINNWNCTICRLKPFLCRSVHSTVIALVSLLFLCGFLCIEILLPMNMFILQLMKKSWRIYFLDILSEISSTTNDSSPSLPVFASLLSGKRDCFQQSWSDVSWEASPCGKLKYKFCLYSLVGLWSTIQSVKMQDLILLSGLWKPRNLHRHWQFCRPLPWWDELFV